MNIHGWAWLLLIPIVFVAMAALCFLHERRFIGRPRAALDSWRRTPLLGKLIVCILAVHFTYQGATKLLRNPPSSPPPAITVVQPDVGDLDVGVAATNLCFVAIERGTNSTALLVAWPFDDRPPLDRVGLFASLELPGPWSHLFDIDISTCTSNALVEVMDAEVSTNSPPTAFFRLGDPAPPDADGDGLSDAEETGEIMVRDEFDWYDTSTFPTTYAPQPQGGLGSYFGASLIANLSGNPVIDGIPLTQAFAFENGFVSLQAPGDWNGAVFPSVPRPLCYRPYYSGSIVVAPYWGVGYVQYGNTNSYMRAGTLADGTTVVEFHDVKRNQMSSEGITYQVIIPGGTGNVVRVSYLSSEFTLDGTGAVAGAQNARRTLPGGLYYSLEWDFTEWGPLQPGTTVEYRFGTGTDPDSADSDNDGLDDWTELYATGTDPWKADTDGDGLSDGDEFALGTAPHSSDTDHDGLPDAWEVANGLDPTSDDGDEGASGDPDRDNLTNAEELQLGTDPQDSDTDGDGLDDDAEVLLGTDPFVDDTDGDGLLDGYEVNMLGSSPFLHDTDGDGLDDVEEDALGTDPDSADTDGDGMGDKWEHLYGFDPTVHNSQSSRTDDDADADYDLDGLPNLQEYALGTNPLLADTDGDTISDYAEFVAGTNPCYADTDGDGLDDLQEQTFTTNPLQPDTDGDGMDDGWEQLHGFNPKIHNAQTARTDDDATADPDGDGLTNAEECAWRTNPSGADADGNGIPDGRDTDGDGVADGAEIAQNSDPADSTDSGQPNSRIPVPFYFGDHSESHSEKYLLEVVPVAAIGMGVAPHTFAWVNANYGACETRTAMLKPGWKYEVRLRHAGTNPTYSGTPRPDYDYTLQPITNNLPPFVQFSDPDSLFGVDDTSSTFAAKDKVATISVYKFTVEEIRFNHDGDACSSDAVNLRKNLREGYDEGYGEWWVGGASLKNDPVCYAGGTIPTVKVRFRVSPDLVSARLSARTVGADSPLGGLEAEDVTFSIGASTWFEFRADARISGTVRKADHRWEWRVSMIDNKNVTAFACATTGPHRVYTVLDVPKEPWEPNGTIQCPWTDALELACTVAEGKSDKVQALAAITSHLFQNMGFVYDAADAESYYCKGFNSGEIMFSLDGYLKKNIPYVNCADQAYGLATFGNLIGIDSAVVKTQPIGYINTIEIVGIGPCNNPGYLGGATTNHIAICGVDDTSRSRLTQHRYVIAEGVVFDACIGPALGTQTNIGYLESIIDTSTDVERLWSPFLFLGNLPVTFKMKFDPRNYWIIGAK